MEDDTFKRILQDKQSIQRSTQSRRKLYRMCWKEKIQWQSVTNGLQKEHVLRSPFLFLDKVLHFFLLMVICNSLNLLLKSSTEESRTKLGPSMNPIIWCSSVSSLILFYIIPRIVNSSLKNIIMHVLFIIDICHMYFLVSIL